LVKRINTTRFEGISKRIHSFFFILSQGAQIASGLIVAMTSLGILSTVAGWINNAIWLIIVGVIVSIVSVIVLYFLYILLKKIEPLGSAPLFAIGKSPVKIIFKEITYQYLPDGQTMYQRKHFELQALQDDVESFTDRYLWTGMGKCIVKSLTPDFKIVNKRREEFWDYFDVLFPRPLKKGEEVSFVIEWDLFDESKKAIPFLSTMIDFPTERLLMRVILPPNLAPEWAYCREYKNYIDRIPINEKKIQCNPMKYDITYDVPHPKRYHKYLIDFSLIKQ